MPKLPRSLKEGGELNGEDSTSTISPTMSLEAIQTATELEIPRRQRGSDVRGSRPNPSATSSNTPLLQEWQDTASNASAPSQVITMSKDAFVSEQRANGGGSIPTYLPSGGSDGDNGDAGHDATGTPTTGLLARFGVDVLPRGLERTGRLCGGIVSDYRQRLPYYWSDIVDGFTMKTLSAALFMFCATFASTVALGDVAYRETDGAVGITEYLFLQGVAGMAHALLAGCPLPVLRPTGPITAFMVDLYALANSLGIAYFSLLGWVGLWVGLFLMLIAAYDLSAYIVLCTRFLHDIYAAFVCTIYISDGIIGVQERFAESSWDEAFFAYYLALMVVVVALLLHYAGSYRVLSARLRRLLADYAVPLAVVLCVGVSYSTKAVGVARISMPRDFQPTQVDDDGVHRAWFQGPGSVWWTPLVALLASVPIVALFYIDQLFSCILGQNPELGLKKGQYYHSSFLIIGICNFIFPMFGMPFVTASLPHSPEFVKALTDYDPHTKRVTRVHESRIAPLLVYLFCFLALAVPSVLEVCPEGIVNGVLTFVGLQGILPGTGNQLIDRVVLLFTAPSEFPTNRPYSQLGYARVHLYTLIQLACLACCWGMRYTGPLALAFPLVIVLYVPFRLVVLPKIFSADELAALDAEPAPSAKGGVAAPAVSTTGVYTKL